jgi:hypothetical protein
MARGQLYSESLIRAIVVGGAAALALGGGGAPVFGNNTGAVTGTVAAGIRAPLPSFLGKAFVRAPDGTLRTGITPASPSGSSNLAVGLTSGSDVFVADGSETALAVGPADVHNLVTVLNQGYTNSPSLLTSKDGNVSWIASAFPAGSGSFTGYPFDPWAASGNFPGELYASFVRTDTNSKLGHVVLAKGAVAPFVWSKFYEAVDDVAQDRPMFDIDRAEWFGGGGNFLHDGKIYLTYDEVDSVTEEFLGSFLEVISPSGAPLAKIQTSSPSAFVGAAMQPVAGTVDGRLYLMAQAINMDGTTTYLVFHEVDDAGGRLTTVKSSIGMPTTGQRLGTTLRFGVNGHRIDSQKQMAIDRSNRSRRGTLYVLADFNPNPQDSSLDQGDLVLFVSHDEATTWSSVPIPGVAEGKTQYFAMLDVDSDGWIHVAYYQNESGLVDGGVLNAGIANVYYTVSSDGGQTWSVPTLVNDPADSLKLFDPPRDRSANDYYLIGDYSQLRVDFVYGLRTVYICWTQYDKNRTDVYLNDKREREICTKVIAPLDTDQDGLFDPDDNCPSIFNPGQEDANGNGVGDVCENFRSRANVDDSGSSHGRIDGSDLFPLARAFGSCQGDPAYDTLVDLSPDGCVDGYDVAVLAAIFGASIP